MADTLKVTYNAKNLTEINKSIFTEVNPSVTDAQIKSVGVRLQDLVEGGDIPTATKSETTTVIVTPRDDEGSDV